MVTDNRQHYFSQISNLPEEQRNAAAAWIEVEYNLKAAQSAYKNLVEVSAKDDASRTRLSELITTTLQEATRMREKYAKDPEPKK